MKNNDTFSKTLLVAVTLCLVCSTLISFTAVGLRDIQDANKELDKQTKILSAAGLLNNNLNISDLFKSIEVKMVNLETGLFDESIDSSTFNEGSFSRNLDTSIKLDKTQDVATLKRRENYQSVYLHYEEGNLVSIILPVRGYGLWGTMKGYLALEPDLQTIIGLEFFEDKETPGLGAEINNPKWKSKWTGKKIYSSEGEVIVSVIKGVVLPDTSNKDYSVDGLSGATITSKGVTNLLKFWLGDLGYGPFITNMRNGEIKDV